VPLTVLIWMSNCVVLTTEPKPLEMAANTPVPNTPGIMSVLGLIALDSVNLNADPEIEQAEIPNVLVMLCAPAPSDTMVPPATATPAKSIPRLAAVSARVDTAAFASVT
jgi:hypothetical protein